MASVSNIICLPGFGDPIVATQWVADLAATVPAGVQVTPLDWPGLWTRWAEPFSFSELVAEVAQLAGPTTAIVGHSLGGLVAAHVAARQDVAAVVAVCSPTLPSVNSALKSKEWRASGIRPTTRLAPNGMKVSFELPVSFLHERDQILQSVVLPRCPTLLIFGADDPVAEAQMWEGLPHPGFKPETVTVAGCGHNFWIEPHHREAVVGAAARFVMTQ